MKRTAFALALALATSLAHPQNSRTVIGVNSEVYRLVRSLSIEQGLGLPSSALPWTVDELEHHLDRIDQRRLSEAGRRAWDRVLELTGRRRLYGEGDRFAFNASLIATLEGYLHIGEKPDPGKGDKDAITLADDEVWEHGFAERLPLLRLPLEAWLFDRIYALLELDLRHEPRKSILRPETLANVATDFYDIYAHMPFRAFIAAGGPHWSLQFGRDTLSWGAGLRGNLMLSQAAGYLDFVRAAAWWRAFKWTTVYAALEPWLTQDELDDDPDAASGGPERYKAFFAHRFEFRVGNVGLGLTEAVVFGRKYPDISYLNPMMVYHNWFEFKISNINMALEAEWTPLPGLAVYAQYVLDQWQTPVEEATYPGASSEPDSFGFLLGLQVVRPAGPGWLEASLEWIHSNPWLYTRRYASPLLSYTVRRRITAAHRYLLDRPLGWEYGPDADSKTLTVGYRVPGSWAAALSAELRAKGSLTINDPYPDHEGTWTKAPYADPNGATTPTGSHPDRRFILTASGEARLLPRLASGGSVAWVRIRNPLGENTGTINDVEITAFVTITY